MSRSLGDLGMRGRKHRTIRPNGLNYTLFILKQHIHIYRSRSNQTYDQKGVLWAIKPAPCRVQPACWTTGHRKNLVPVNFFLANLNISSNVTCSFSTSCWRQPVWASSAAADQLLVPLAAAWILLPLSELNTRATRYRWKLALNPPRKLLLE